ncbi:LPS export ABC transporter permease LptG [Sphingoaurantiacus capsulatus]|uniref:LPS export ABC transporter permease LptG n=1 Tax=Sphingoaurantiacus capsulatus TaxID=1771310 RepID=A0ABV7XEB5_9SPHN
MVSFSLPSRTIALYTAKLFAVRVLAFLLTLTVILQTLDLLTESSKILAVDGNGNPELWRYVTLRIPQLINQFLPFSVLLATLVTLATLNQNSEIVIFKAAGISAHQILAPLVAVAFGIAAVHFLFSETVLVNTNRELNAWERVEYGKLPAVATTGSEAWVREGGMLFHAQVVSGLGMNTRLTDVTAYDRTGGALRTITHAESARPTATGWVLEGVRRFDVQRGRQEVMPRFEVQEGIDPARFTATAVDPDQTSFFELRHAIREVRAAGRPVDTLVAGLHHKISGPLSALLMPLLGAVAAFGLARSGKLFIRTVVGMGLGFAYFVADNFMLAMGQFGAAPPVLAAWAPFLLFFLIGEAVLFRTEE